MRLKDFFRDKRFVAILIFGLLSNGAVWLIFKLGLDFDKTALILHYNSFFGIDKIAVNSEERRLADVFFAPLGGLAVMLINFLLGGFLVYSSRKKRLESSDFPEEGKLEKISTAALGGWLILLAGIIFQLVIAVYAAAIFFVNK